MIYFYLSILDLSLILFGPPVFANDSVSSVTVKGIEFSNSDSVALRKENLQLTRTQISVDYVFENTSDVDQDLLVSFPLPPLGANLYDNRESFPDFQVTVDGKNISYKTECRAFIGSKEITEELKEIGLPLCEFKRSNQLLKNQLEEVIQKKIYSTDNPDEDLNPVYLIHRKYYWNQKFPAKKKIHVSHRYKPQMGGNSVGTLNHEWKEFLPKDIPNCWTSYPGQLTEEEASICESMRKQENGKQTHLSVSYLEYIITSANTWKNGIDNFDLIATGGTIILADVDGSRDADLGELKMHRVNFKPKKEILIEFLGEGKANLIPSNVPVLKEIDGPANCRSSPNGKIVTSIPNGTIVNLRDRKEDWYHIFYKNKHCWTSRTNLRFK